MVNKSVRELVWVKRNARYTLSWQGHDLDLAFRLCFSFDLKAGHRTAFPFGPFSPFIDEVHNPFTRAQPSFLCPFYKLTELGPPHILTSVPPDVN
jgi:hypothetical protein